MSNCKACGANVLFVRSERGNTMCLNAVPDTERGNVRLQPSRDGAQVARVLANTHAAQVRATSMEALYLSHFATCPDAQRFRKPSSHTGAHA